MKVLCAGMSPGMCQELGEHGFFVEAGTGIESPSDLADWLSADQGYEACVCDYGGLPFNGDSAQYLRDRKIATPLIGLYQLPEVQMFRHIWSAVRAESLDYGLDDALLKPVTIAEVGASLRAVYRRYCHRCTDHFVLRFRGHSLEVDLRSRLFWLDGSEEPLKLTNKPTELLMLLASSPGQAIRCEEVMRILYGEGREESESNTLQVFLTRIRNLLDPEREWVEGFIETVRGYGYRLNAE